MKKATNLKIKKGEGFPALLFLIPSLIGICIFFLFPFVDSVRRSFFTTSADEFVGLKNYTSVLSNDAFKLAAYNTTKFIGICIPLLLVLSLSLALLVNLVKPRGALFKTSFLLPMAVPVASIVLLWNVLFNKSGIINGLLQNIGITSIDFMETSAAFWFLFLPTFGKTVVMI